VGVLLLQPDLKAHLGKAAQVDQRDVAPVGAEGDKLVAGEIHALVAEVDAFFPRAGSDSALGAPELVQWATAPFAANLLRPAVEDLAGGALQPFAVLVLIHSIDVASSTIEAAGTGE